VCLLHGEDIGHAQEVVKEASFIDFSLEDRKGETDPKMNGRRRFGIVCRGLYISHVKFLISATRKLEYNRLVNGFEPFRSRCT
jgi:hypothetical protein